MKQEFEKITLKNVLTNDGVKDFTVEIVPFNRRNDDHVDFALSYIDMLGRMPSQFRTITDAAVRAVELFMVHKENDTAENTAIYEAVRSDKRAARELFNTPSIQKALNDFFENA